MCRGRDAEAQAITWMCQPALAPVGSAFCGHSPEVASHYGGETGEASRDIKAGCRKSVNFNGSGRRDAARGESRQGCRVSPCPLKLTLFREAAGHPVRREGLHRLSPWEVLEICVETMRGIVNKFTKIGLKQGVKV